MDNIRSLFFKTLISSIAVSVVIGVLVALFGAYERGGKIFATSLTITIAAFSMFVNGIFFEKLIGKILPYAGFILTPVCAIICIAYIWDGVDEEPLGTALTLLGANFFMFPMAIFAERRGARIVPILGVIATLIASAYMILMIWDFRSDNQLTEKIAMTAWTMALTCFYLSLVLLIRLKERFEWSRTAVTIVAWAAFALGAYIIWFEPQGKPIAEWIGRAGIIISIFIAALTVLIPIFHFIDRPEKLVGANAIEEIDAEIERLRGEIERLEAKKASLSA